MGTVVRRNERSWAIEIISQINGMLKRLNIRIRKAGGESTLSVNKKSMFPDVLLYADEAQMKILQGWELKMPDVLITDEAFIKDAARKAEALGLNSFVLWNFTYGKLYTRDEDGEFTEKKTWDATSYIRTREDVYTFRQEWLFVLEEIILTVNEYLVSGDISAVSITEVLSDNLITRLIRRNKAMTAEYMEDSARRDMKMEIQLKLWWNAFREEYDNDEKDMYQAYAKTVLLNWANRILFANLIRRYHNCADLIGSIDETSVPEEGNAIIRSITEQGDFYNVFRQMEYNDRIPEDTWIDLVDYNQFLYTNRIERIDQSVLQNVLEHTVHVAKREIRGQYATPYSLADLLCQITVRNWMAPCADLCAGTGTIAKAVIQNKLKRNPDPKAALDTTWISDKYAYPLQIANIALTSIEMLDTPINLFQKNVFELKTGDDVVLKSPTDGSDIIRQLPPFHAVVSNLPFVKYNKRALDEEEYIQKIRQSVWNHTGITFTSGKEDLYIYMPFQLYGLLEQNGRLGIILSNSWLGTDVGNRFFHALLHYYHMETVVLSNSGKWFENAEVVATMVVLQKKEIAPPSSDERIRFCLLNREVRKLSAEEMETVVASIVVGRELEKNLLSMTEYGLEEIEMIQSSGITLNALFHQLTWLGEIRRHLIPVKELLEVKRGERRGWNDLFYPKDIEKVEEEYRRPVLKRPASLKSYMAYADTGAFCCHRAKEELRQMGHSGALKWIEKFENIRNGTGKLLPDALKRPGGFWYEMEDDTKAEFVTALNPDKRLFVARFPEETFVDQRFTRMIRRREEVSADLIHALLNSVYGMFAIEAIGFGRGLGVLDASSTRLKQMYMIDPADISAEDEKEIIRLFERIRDRDVLDTKEELQDPGRREFDRKVLESIGCGHLYDKIRESLLSMQRTRHTVL